MGHQGQELAVGNDGTVYSYGGNGETVIAIKNGKSRTVTGRGTKIIKVGIRPGPAKQFRFRSPKHISGLVVDRKGDLIISADPGIIVRVHRGKLSLVASDPKAKQARNRRDPTGYVLGVSPTPDGGFIYVDNNNQRWKEPYRIRKVSLKGKLTTLSADSYGFSADGLPLRKTRIYLSNGAHSTKDGIYFIDFPSVKFVPWSGKSIPWDQATSVQRPMPVSGPRVQTLQDVLKLAENWSPARTALEESHQFPPEFDASLLDFYKKLLAQKLNSADRAMIAPFVAPNSFYASQLRLGVKPGPFRADKVDPTGARVLRFLTAQISPVTLRNADPKLTLADQSVREKLQVFDSTGKASRDAFYRYHS